MRANSCTKHTGYLLPTDVLEGLVRSRCPALTSIVTALHGCAAEVAAHPQAPEPLQRLCVPQNVMLSDYGPGDYYQRHLDSHGPEENPRAITLLLYLNSSWGPTDGGL